MRYDDKVEARRQQIDSLLCIGLDPEIDRLPVGIDRDPEGVFAFLREIVDATYGLACAYKPNFAFYEAMGVEGFGMLQRIIKYIHETQPSVPVIADAKRSDIGNSARMYARAALDTFGCDAIVVNPYQGSDSVEAYLAHSDHGVYVLARTSNPGSVDLQELTVAGEPLYVHVVRRAQQWRRSATLGFVVGATASDQLQRVRQVAPEAPLLVPGIGAQGGDLVTSVRVGQRANGGGLLLNASRAVLYASPGPDFASQSHKEALRLVNAMRDAGSPVIA